MTFTIIFSENFKKNLVTLKKKDKTTYEALQKKILQISSSDRHSIEHYKNLRGNLSDFHRVHISSFVLIFRVVDDTIAFEEFEHHDTIYKTKK
jgi:YafQ family addiction module toxin component